MKLGLFQAKKKKRTGLLPFMYILFLHGTLQAWKIGAVLSLWRASTNLPFSPLCVASSRTHFSEWTNSPFRTTKNKCSCLAEFSLRSPNPTGISLLLFSAWLAELLIVGFSSWNSGKLSESDQGCMLVDDSSFATPISVDMMRCTALIRWLLVT